MKPATTFVIAACLCVLVVSGCDRDDAAALELTEDQLEQAERRASQRLRELGCKVVEAEDQWIGTSGIAVKIATEHITEDGEILLDVLVEFRYLRRLFLIVDRTPIGEKGLAQLRKLNNLLLLSAQTTMTDDKGLAQIEGIVSLRLLRLNRSLISDNSLRHIERLPDLKLLYLSNTLLTDEAMPHIAELTQLTSLKIENTKLTDKGVAHLEALPGLIHLGLTGTGITDKSVPVLLGLKKLQHLTIDQTKLTDSGLRQLVTGLPECRIECVILEAERPIVDEVDTVDEAATK
jgi:hypothetical protein